MDMGHSWCCGLRFPLCCSISLLCMAFHGKLKARLEACLYSCSEIMYKEVKFFVHLSQNKPQDESFMKLQGTANTGKRNEMIHQTTLNDDDIDFQNMPAWKMNKVSLCVLDSSDQHEMLTQIAKSTKSAIHLHGKLQYLFVTG